MDLEKAKLEALYDKIRNDMQDGGLHQIVQGAMMYQRLAGRLNGKPIHNFLDGFAIGAFSIAYLLQSGKMHITTLEINTSTPQSKGE